jgi:nucleoid-associated protein YgaU
VVEAVTGLAVACKALGESLAPAVRGGELDARRVGAARATLAGALVDARAVRRDLDGRDVLEHQVAGLATDTIALWRWERATRASLVRLSAVALDVDARAAAWLLGRQESVCVVRSGDTLQSLAARHLGDWAAWPRIAALNQLPAGPLVTGAVLQLPPRR